jgi:glycosyltransferase involved in cell wall biosynthesis
MDKEDQEERIIVIIPCYNEEQNLAKVLDELREIKKHWRLDLLFINDCSSDNTELILRNEKEAYINHPVNLGYNSAIQTGLKYGLESGYKFFILMDGDGQHPPSEIEKFLNNFGEEADLLIGSRFGNGYSSTYKIPIIRKLGMIFFSVFTSLLIGSRIKDTTSGFQMFSDRVAKVLLYVYDSPFPDAEVLFLLNLLKFRIKEIPVEMRMRESGESMISSFNALYYPLRVLSGLIFTYGRYFMIRGKVKNA